jgi:hypothetical protein
MVRGSFKSWSQSHLLPNVVFEKNLLLDILIQILIKVSQLLYVLIIGEVKEIVFSLLSWNLSFEMLWKLCNSSIIININQVGSSMLDLKFSSSIVQERSVH